jgi:hypothetical protein
MCFSASASFVAGGSLCAVGVATLSKARGAGEVPFAAIPMLFGIQQLIEGVLWLSFRFDAALLNQISTYAYSMFSHVLWPALVPIAAGLLEAERRRRKVFLAFQLGGIAVAVYLLYLIVRFPITSRIDQHIVYVSPHFYQLPVMTLYLAATCASCMFSSQRLVRVFGGLALLSFGAAYWIHAAAFFSVWCFFAAILSAIIYLQFMPPSAAPAVLRRPPA